MTTRHIPVQVITKTMDRQRALKLGAFSVVQKPVGSEDLSEVIDGIERFVERKVKNLLVVEDDDKQRRAIMDLIGNEDVQTVAVGTGAEALAELRAAHFDCMVIDLGLPDMSGFDVLKRLKKELGLYDLPVIVYTGKEIVELTPKISAIPDWLLLGIG